MKNFNFLMIPFLGFIIFSINKTDVSTKENDISESLYTIKYVDSSNKEKNMYSTSIDYSELLASGKEYGTDTKINAILYYDSKKYELANYSIANVNKRPDGQSKEDYVATYVYKHLLPSIKTYSSTINSGNLGSIGYSFQKNNNFNIDVSVENEIGAGGNVFGIEAKAGIKKFFNAAAGFGSGNAFTLEYDFNRSHLKPYANYSIKKTTHYYEFITVIFKSQYSESWAWFNYNYNWLDYSHYTYLTNSIILDTYSLVEA